MNVRTGRQQRREGFTLEKAVGVAVLLHLLLGALLTWWPGLLVPAEALAAPEPPPLQFRFVDSPATEPPPEPPDTEDLSDIDRQVADASERDDQDTPFSEGNTPQSVVRLPQELAEALTAERPTPQPTVTEPEPVAEEQPTEPAPSAETGELARTEEAVETTTTANPETARPRVPPRRGLRNSLARLEAYVDPQLFDNPRGGAPGQKSLAQFNTRGFDLGPYLRQVLAIIERNWHATMPPLIQTGVSGATFLALSIQRQRQPDGREVAILVAERTWSSGQPAYDAAAHFSFELSNPLPPIPDFYPHDTIEGRLGFLYNVAHPDDIDFPDQ